MIQKNQGKLQYEVLRELQQVGLTKDEARVYLALMDAVEETATFLCKITGLPNSKIYNILRSLERLGLIYVQEGNPKIYKSLHPFEAFENLKILAATQYEQKLRLLNSLINYFTSSYQRADFEYLLKKRTHELNERINELHCLFDVSKTLMKIEEPLDTVMQEIVRYLPPAWEYPHITCARIVINDKEFTTDNFCPTSWTQSTDIIVSGEKIGVIEIFYLEARPEMDEGPFLKEERALLEALAREVSKYYMTIESTNALKRTIHDLDERRKEFYYLYTFSELLMSPESVEKPFADIMQELVVSLPLAWQYPDITCARIIIDGNEFVTENFQLTPWKQVADIVLAETRVGAIEIYYLEARPEIDEGPFLKEERYLIDTLAREVIKYYMSIESTNALKRTIHDLDERRKEFYYLYTFSELLMSPESVEKPFADIMQELVVSLPLAWQYPDITCARVIIDENEFVTENFQLTPWKQVADIVLAETRVGAIEIYYLEARPEIDEGPFLKEERYLIDTLTRLVTGFLMLKKRC